MNTIEIDGFHVVPETNSSKEGREEACAAVRRAVKEARATLPNRYYVVDGDRGLDALTSGTIPDILKFYSSSFNTELEAIQFINLQVNPSRWRVVKIQANVVWYSEEKRVK